MLKRLAGYVISAVIIYLCLIAGNALQHYLHIPVPGSVLGLMILFIGLSTGVVRAHFVEPSASALVKYMIILFIPVSVGLMVHLDTLIEHFWTITLSTVGGSLIVLVLMAVALERLLVDKKRDEQ